MSGNVPGSGVVVFSTDRISLCRRCNFMEWVAWRIRTYICDGLRKAEQQVLYIKHKTIETVDSMFKGVAHFYME